MRICIEIATGRLIEAQSNATPGTLIQNAVNAGYDPKAVEERVLAEDEYVVLLAAQSVQQPQASFLARDLIAALTADDYAAIQSAISNNSALGLLWAALLAQGSVPILFSSDRFQAGWSALSSVLGADRAASIRKSLGT